MPVSERKKRMGLNSCWPYVLAKIAPKTTGIMDAGKENGRILMNHFLKNPGLRSISVFFANLILI
jgi:hypothetical protein